MINSRKSILIIDDEPEICAFVTSVLAAKSFDVVNADSIESALEKLSGNGFFDLIILDFWLNGEHAVPILDLISTLNYDVGILLISGGNQGMALETVEAIARVSGAMYFLQKPFRKADLIQTVSSIFEDDVT